MVPRVTHWRLLFCLYLYLISRNVLFVFWPFARFWPLMWLSVTCSPPKITVPDPDPVCWRPQWPLHDLNWASFSCFCHTSTPFLTVTGCFLRAAAASPRWTAASPSAQDTWATTGPRWRTSPRTPSPVSAPRRPPHPAAPRRKRGSSSRQVSWVTLLHSHTRPSLSWDSFPSAAAHCACATPTTTDSSFFLKLLDGRGVGGVKSKCYLKIAKSKA